MFMLYRFNDYLESIFYKIKWDIISDEDWNTFKSIKYFFILKFYVLFKMMLNSLLVIKNVDGD